MAVTLVAEGSVLQFQDASGKPVVPSKIRKTELQKCLVEVVEENRRLRQELDTLKPSARPTGKLIKVDPNAIVQGLPEYEPHSKIECPVHGKSQSNKKGVCALCFLERARGKMAA